MKKYMRMLLALAFVAVLVLLCGAALAEEEITIVASGTCGENVTWQLDSAGELTISGTGKMTNYYRRDEAPWYSRRSFVLKVTIEEGVTSIGEYAFRDCSSLTSIVIPDSVTSIGSCAFYDCSSLTSISIPKGVAELEWGTFEGCSSLEEVYTPSLETWLNIDFSDVDSTPMYYADKLYVGGELLTNAVIPDSVTSIGYYAFYGCSSLTSVSIPDSVTSIGCYAFEYCSNLKSISIPNSVEEISYYTFGYCSSLESVDIPNSVTSIANCAFEHCSSLKSIIIPDSVTSIGEYTFYDCGNIESVSIGSGVTSIGENAFTDCDSLESISIPSSVTNIGSYAFTDCDSLKEVTIPQCAISGRTGSGKKGTFSYLFDETQIEKITIADGVTTIGNFAFSDCSGLKSINIPDSVTSIEDNAFWNCNNLKEVYIPSLEAWLNISFSYYISDPMEYASELYIGGELLTNAVIPESVTSIRVAAFENCSSLTSVSIPDSVTSIDDVAFRGCSSLTSITIPNSVTSIGWGVFYGCSSLKSISLPNSVTSIDEAVFCNCNELTDVYYAGTKAEWAEITIEEEDNECLFTATIHCSDDGIKPELKADDILYLPKKIRTIADEAFRDGSFEAVVLPDGCETIGSRAFAGCDKLVYIRMPDSVTSIADDAFDGCKNLTFICESDNAAAAYAKAQGIEFVIDQ